MPAPRLNYGLAAKPLAYHLIDADGSAATWVLCRKPLCTVETPPKLPV